MAFSEFRGLLKKWWVLALAVFVVVAAVVGALLVPQAQLASVRVTLTVQDQFDAFGEVVGQQAEAAAQASGVEVASVFQNPKTHAITITLKGTDPDACRNAAVALGSGVIQAANEKFQTEGALGIAATEPVVKSTGKSALAGSVLAALALGLFAAACAVLLAGTLKPQRALRRTQEESAQEPTKELAQSATEPVSNALSSSTIAAKAPLACYYLAFFLYAGAYICEYTTLSGRYTWLPTAYIAVRWVALALLTPKFISQRYTTRGIVCAALLVGVGAISFAVTQDVSFLMMFCFIAAAQDVDVKVLAKIVLVEELVMFAVLLGMSQAGMIQSIQAVRDTTVRQALGYSHPNRLGAALTAMCCAYAVIRFPKVQLQDFALFAVAAAFAWFVPMSRTATLVIILTAVVYLVCSFAHGRRGQRVVLVCLALAFIAFAGFSLYLMTCYDSQVEWQLRLNQALSNRPQLMHEYFLQYPRTLFGFNSFEVPVWIYEGASIVIDNAYARAFLTGGVVPSVVFLVLYVALFVWAVKNNRLEAAVLGAFVYAMVGCTEWLTMHFALNYCLAGCAAFLIPKPDAPQAEAEAGALPAEAEVDISPAEQKERA